MGIEFLGQKVPWVTDFVIRFEEVREVQKSQLRGGFRLYTPVKASKVDGSSFSFRDMVNACHHPPSDVAVDEVDQR